MARAQESSDFLREMVYGRLNWPTGLTEQAKIQYEQYLKEHIEQIASDFIRQKRGEELEWLLHTYPLEQGQKELFTGLAVERLEKDWIKYPILHLDLNIEKYDTPESLDKILNDNLEYWESQYGTRPSETFFSLRFAGIIRKDGATCSYSGR